MFKNKMFWTLGLPLAVFALILFFLWVGLHRDPRMIPSPLQNKPAPQFQAHELYEPAKIVTERDFQGKVTILNVFASWCVACQAEHTVWMEAKRDLKNAQIIGLNYKDNREKALQWLKQYGNPYAQVIDDPAGEIGINYGVYGTPETFIIDKNGVIRYKFIGAASPADWRKILLPEIKKLAPAYADAVDRYPFPRREQQQQFQGLLKELRCLVCQNQDLADSNADLAKDLRAQVYQQVLSGKSDAEIKKYLQARYGDFILFKPPVNFQTLILWLSPFIFLGAGFWVIWRMTRSRRSKI